MATVYLGLGGNIGDTKSQLLTSIKALEEAFNSKSECSYFYQTPAWGKTDQADFINCCVKLESSLSPEETLKTIQSIENKMGRTRDVHWGPRTVDIDILFYDDLIIQSDTLQIPHPFIQERNFVLFPLNDIAANFMHPTLNLTIKELCAACKDTSAIQKIIE